MVSGEPRAWRQTARRPYSRRSSARRWRFAPRRSLIEALPDTLLGKRDHALLVIGFAGAFRRSELVALTMEDIQTTHEGLIVTLRRSKTDSAARQLR